MPHVIDDLVIEAIDAVSSRAPGVEDWTSDLIPAAWGLSDQYIGRQGPAPGPQKWYAYLPAYVPRYLPRLSIALAAAGLELRALLESQGRGQVTVLDLGCGPGTLAVACLDELERSAAALGVPSKISVSLTGRDAEESALEVATVLIGYLKDHNRWPHLDVSWQPQQRDIRDNGSADDRQSFDIVTAGHVLCELAREAYPHDISELISALLKAELAPNGIAALIEPIQPGFLENFLTVRDHFSHLDELHIWGPCLGSAKQCPEWERPSQREHSCGGAAVVEWRDTGAGKRLRDFAGQIAGKWVDSQQSRGWWSFFSCLVLARTERPTVPAGVGTTVRRKGRWGRCFVCAVGKDGREYLVQIDTKNLTHPSGTPYRAVHLSPSPIMEAATPPPYSVTPVSLSALNKVGWPTGT